MKIVDEWFDQYLLNAIKADDAEFAALLVRLQIDFHKYVDRMNEVIE